MRAKYLGSFYIDYREDEDNIADDMITVLVNEEDEEDVYNLDTFMVNDGIFNGVSGESNTSAIGMKLNGSGDGGKLWRVW